MAIGGDVALALRYCPPGRFMMGSPEHEKGRVAPREKQHTVVLTQGFWMGETPVTQALWEAVMGDNPSRFKGATLPVEQVDWNRCVEFCGKLNEAALAESGWVFGLPSESR